MKQLVTRLDTYLQVTPVDNILRVVFNSETKGSIMTVYLKNGDYFDTNGILIDTNMSTNSSYVANFYSKQSTYVDHKNCVHELGFKEIDDYIYSITYCLFGN